MENKECIKTCTEIYRLSQQAAQTLKQQGSSCDMVINNYKNQYNAVVAQNKSLQGELKKRREYLLQAQNEVLQLIIGTQEKRHAKYIFSVLNKILERED